jgi:heme-degrading monooxygenase HmoA
MIAKTPEPPYYAVIFSSVNTENVEDYSEMAQRMVELASDQKGFLGVESARNELGITVSYWKDLDSIKAWKENAEHSVAQHEGKKKWYECYKTRIAKVERDYAFDRKSDQADR